MGWISKRRNKTGYGLAHGHTKGSRASAPLRLIVSIEQEGDWSMFGRGDYVVLECGHKVYSKGNKKARCHNCQNSNWDTTN